MKKVRIDWIEKHSAIVEIEDNEDALDAGMELDREMTMDSQSLISEKVLRETCAHGLWDDENCEKCSKELHDERQYEESRD